MLNLYPGKKLRNLRKRANLTQMQVVELTGISETTLHYLEHGLRRPQTKTLEKLLSLYAIRIIRLEKLEQIWGPDGLENKPSRPERIEPKGEQTCKAKSVSPNLYPAPNASKPAFMLSVARSPRMTAS